MTKLLSKAEIKAITKAAYTGGKDRSPQADVYKLLNHVEGLREQNEALLEAVKWCVNQGWVRYTSRVKGQNDRFCDGVDAVHAAITKATGEPS
jgi:hypothetical protein